MRKQDPEYRKEFRMRKENGIFTYRWKPEEEAPILKITKSSLGSYQFCPLNYKYGYLDDINQKVSPAMTKGTIIHDAQEQFWKMVNIEEALTYSDEPMKLQKHFRGIYPEAPAEDYEDIYRAMTAYNTERFLECIQEETLGNFVPVGNEVVMNGAFTTDSGVSVHLMGIIDRIFYEDGGYILMELKTGAWKDTKKTSMRKEMAFYKMLYENSNPEDIIAAGLDPEIPINHWGWYFPASNYVYAEKVSSRSATAVLNSMDKLINSYLEDEFAAAYYYKKCIHCGHFDHCEAAQGSEQNDWF
tara:strand:+ start:2289 stop:3188 length:900 start_codon:yes stop_codon:yes gene_type:complete